MCRKCCKRAQKQVSRRRPSGLHAEALEALPVEQVVEAREHPLGEQVELLRPDRRLAADAQLALARRGRRARRREGLAGGLRPYPQDLRQQRRRHDVGGQPPGRRRYRAGSRAPPAASRSTTSPEESPVDASAPDRCGPPPSATTPSPTTRCTTSASSPPGTCAKSV